MANFEDRHRQNLKDVEAGRISAKDAARDANYRVASSKGCPHGHLSVTLNRTSCPECRSQAREEEQKQRVRAAEKELQRAEERRSKSIDRVNEKQKQADTDAAEAHRTAEAKARRKAEQAEERRGYEKAASFYVGSGYHPSEQKQRRSSMPGPLIGSPEHSRLDKRSKVPALLGFVALVCLATFFGHQVRSLLAAVHPVSLVLLLLGLVALLLPLVSAVGGHRWAKRTSFISAGVLLVGLFLPSVLIPGGIHAFWRGVLVALAWMAVIGWTRSVLDDDKTNDDDTSTQDGTATD